MKTVIFLLAFALAGTAQATTKPGVSPKPKKNYYECYNLGDTPEFSVIVDLDKNRARLTDGDLVSSAKLVSTSYIETFPVKIIYTFTGKEKYTKNKLIIEYNLNGGSVVVKTVDKDGKELSWGSAECEKLEQPRL